MRNKPGRATEIVIDLWYEDLEAFASEATDTLMCLTLLCPPCL